MIYAIFSSDANYVYAFSSTKNLYIFDKKTGKLVSLLLIPLDKPDELNGMVVSAIPNQSDETMVIYSLTNLFKLDSATE